MSWAASQAGKVLVEKAKVSLTKRAERKAYGHAMSEALRAVGREYPELLSSFFDQHFLETAVAEELKKYLTRALRPDPQAIADAYAKQFRSGVSIHVLPAVELFLRTCESEFAKKSELQGILNNRQIHETLSLVRSLHTQELHSEQTPLDVELVIQKFAIASQPLFSWPQGLESGEWLERPELLEIQRRLEEEKTSTTLLLGGPGCGKSALLSRLCDSRREKHLPVLAIKADQLPDSLDSLEALKAFLDLPAPVSHCLKQVAKTRPTLLVIDQLDALSELLDLRTQRLQVLLRLLTEARSIEGLHIVCSCRSFDRTYDSRLSSIEANELSLDPPPWELVEEVLKQHGLAPGQWPQEFREILRIPQCLKLFVRHYSGEGEQRVFDSYLAMLEHLWSTRLLGQSAAPRVGDLLYEIATEMAEREVMFVPTAKYDHQRQALDHAVQCGFMQYDATGRQISFSHQTIFDFTRARAFVAREQSLSAYVLARQSGLHVRPKLWSALHYLRASDPRSYEREVGAIWITENLRAHVRMLLIDFLGLQESPSQAEVAWMEQTFTDKEFSAHSFAAIAGRAAWFAVVDRGPLAQAMVDEEMAWPASRVLNAAWHFAPVRVLGLVKRHWVEQKNWNVAWQTLRGIVAWTEDALALARQILNETDVHPSSISDLATVISSSAPELATELLGFHLKKRIDVAIASRPKLDATTDESAESDSVADHIERRNKDELRQLLESDAHFYELPSIAEAAPHAYLTNVWPPVRMALEVLARETHAGPSTYMPDYLMSTRLEVDSGTRSREHPLMDSFVYATEGLAEQDPEKFLHFVESQEASESATVHRLLALGLCKVSSYAPDFALRYLLGDLRRLSLENFHEDERETKLLIDSLCPHINETQMQTLEAHIRDANIYASSAEEDSAADRLRLSKLNRLFRLRLLLRLPRERLSSSAQQLIDSELRLFPSFKDDRREVEMFTADSGMKPEAMTKAKPETIARFLASEPDETGWGDDHPFRRTRRGGSIQASRAFAEFAKSDLPKALTVIRNLNPATQQRPAAYAIRDLKREHLDDHTLTQLILELDAKGFNGDEFRQCCASNLRGRVRMGTGLLEEGILLLEKWLEEYQPDSSEPEIHSTSENETERRKSILWGGDGFHTLPHASYPILDAWFYALLARTTIDSPRIFAGLRRQLAKRDHFAVWRAMAVHSLTELRFLDPIDARSFLDELFSAYPALLSDSMGQMLIAHSIAWAPLEASATWITNLRRVSSPTAEQAYGELLMLRHVYKGDNWSDSAIEDILRAPHATESEAFLGALYGAANLWDEASQRATLTSILCLGMQSDSREPAAAALQWFSRLKELRIDVDSRPVLMAFATGKALATVDVGTQVLERMIDVLDDDPALVGDVAQRLIDRFKAEIGSLASGAALHSEYLLSIALTLQRLQDPYRSKGLDLFEQLLRYEAYRARDVLRDIDRRPGASVSEAQLRPRRRRSRNTKAKRLAVAT